MTTNDENSRSPTREAATWLAEHEGCPASDMEDYVEYLMNPRSHRAKRAPRDGKGKFAHPKD